jgi:predicted nuclease with TOPRIM domain
MAMTKKEYADLIQENIDLRFELEQEARRCQSYQREVHRLEEELRWLHNREQRSAQMRSFSMIGRNANVNEE